jgi:peptidoglycan/xylan/chitin deacetylase (PgdA/CDA1 family)
MALYAPTVLYFHHVANVDSAHFGSMSLDAFRWFIDALADTTTLARWDSVFANEQQSVMFHEPRILFSFDDGYSETLQLVPEVLSEYQIDGAFFVTSDLVGKRKRHGTMPGESAFASWAEIREVARQGFLVGSHGKTHRRLGKLGESEIRQEIHDSVKQIEDNISVSCKVMSYPHGDVPPTPDDLPLPRFCFATASSPIRCWHCGPRRIRREYVEKIPPAQETWDSYARMLCRRWQDQYLVRCRHSDGRARE